MAQAQVETKLFQLDVGHFEPGGLLRFVGRLIQAFHVIHRGGLQPFRHHEALLAGELGGVRPNPRFFRQSKLSRLR